MADQRPIRILYRNWRGEERVRAIHPIYFWYGATKWHLEEQWFVKAIDPEEKDNDVKDFALKGVLAWDVEG